MNASLLVVLVALVFVGLLVAGRRGIARGANPDVATGAMLLVLATVVGVPLVVLVLGMV